MSQGAEGWLQLAGSLPEGESLPAHSLCPATLGAALSGSPPHWAALAQELAQSITEIEPSQMGLKQMEARPQVQNQKVSLAVLKTLWC